MKKICVLIPLLLLLLTACGNQGDGNGTEGTTIPETLPSYYHEQSDIEKLTGGAILQYDLPDSQGYRWVKQIGKNVLLASDSDLCQLRLVRPETGEEIACLQVEDEVLDICQTLPNGFAYYDGISNSVCYLDENLQQIQSVSLGTNVQTPVISPDGSEIYHCVDNEIRAYDVEHKISRLIKEHGYAQLELVGTCIDGSQLICQVVDGQTRFVVYISASNGQTVYTENEIDVLRTFKEQYYAERMDGIVRQRIVGAVNATAQQLNVPDTYVFGAPEIGGAVGYGLDKDGNLVLNYYDIASGKCTANFLIPGIDVPSHFCVDPSTGCVWLVVTAADGGQKLLKWDTAATAVSASDAVYTGVLFTADSVDDKGLKECNDRVSQLNSKYGVRIRIWEDAVKSPGEHTLEGEYQVAAIQQLLDQLEPVLDEFPKKFLQKSISSRIRICLVRSVDGEQKAVQYWAGEYAFIVLSAGIDVRTEFMKGLGFVIDSHVLGNSPKFDYWDSLNPAGFVYGTGADEKYLQSESRAFVDMDSMQTVTADRSRIFWQAMMPDNKELFEGEIMQSKLKLLCQAIRDAWYWEDKTEVFLWEQYLNEPIAKVKK